MWRGKIFKWGYIWEENVSMGQLEKSFYEGHTWENNILENCKKNIFVKIFEKLFLNSDRSWDKSYLMIQIPKYISFNRTKMKEISFREKEKEPKQYKKGTPPKQ